MPKNIRDISKSIYTVLFCSLKIENKYSNKTVTTTVRQVILTECS